MSNNYSLPPTWDQELQRTILACAVRGDLLKRLPGATTPELLGAPQPKQLLPPSWGG